MLSILTTEFTYEAKFIPNTLSHPLPPPPPHTHIHTQTENTFSLTHLLRKCLPLSNPSTFLPTTERQMTMSFRFRPIRIHYVDTHLYVKHFGHMLHLCNQCLTVTQRFTAWVTISKPKGINTSLEGKSFSSSLT